MWAAANNIYVRRTASSSPEALYTSAPKAWNLDVFHGGHNIFWIKDDSARYLEFHGGSWTTGTQYDYFDLDGASFRSSQGMSHDGDMSMSWSVEISPAGNPTSESLTLTIYDTLGSRNAVLDFPITYLHPTPRDSEPERQIKYVATAFPPTGDTALVAVNRIRRTSTGTSFECYDDRGIPATCYEYSSVSVPDTAYLYSVSTRSSTPTIHLLRKLADTAVYNLALSEREDKTIVTFGAQVDSVDTHGHLKSSLQWCEMQHRNSRVAGTVGFSVANLSACPDFGYGGIGGFSAFRTKPGKSFGSPILHVTPRRPAKQTKSPGTLAGPRSRLWGK